MPSLHPLQRVPGLRWLSGGSPALKRLGLDISALPGLTTKRTTKRWSLYGPNYRVVSMPPLVSGLKPACNKQKSALRHG